MSSRLPEFVDPWRSADQKRHFSGTVELEKLPRLTDVLMSTEGEAVFELIFDRDDKRRSRIKGSVRATMVLQCQRCLEAMLLPVDISLDLAVIEVPEEAERLPEETEPVQVEDGLIRLLDLVEEELILAIPQVPMHAREQCSTESADAMKDAAESSEQESVSETSDNPFAVLADLKKDLKH